MSEILNLKEDFRKFCSLLSVKEIVSNLPLIRVMERIERMLQTILA